MTSGDVLIFFRFMSVHSSFVCVPISNLPQGGFTYTTPELGVKESYLEINLYFSAVYINQLYFSTMSSYSRRDYTAIVSPFKPVSLFFVTLAVP